MSIPANSSSTESNNSKRYLLHLKESAINSKNCDAVPSY